MAIDFTYAQKCAIESQKATLVSAAAGSGKTAVLVSRVISKIAPEDENATAPIPADRLLIVTFTNSAAAEMRNRIERALYEKIKAHPEKKYLSMQKHLLSCADICTIDSFCAKFVRENFSYFGISPDFAVSDGAELTEKRKLLLTDILKPYFKEKTAEFNTALEITGCEYDESNLCAFIEEVFDEAMLRPFTKDYYNSLLLPYQTPFEPGHVWYDGIMIMAQNKIKECLADCNYFCDNAARIEISPEKYISYGEKLRGVLETLNTAAFIGYNAFKEAVSQAGLGILPRATKSDCFVENVKEIKKRIKTRIDKLSDMFVADVSEIEENRKQLLPAVNLLVSLCKEFEEKYFELCKEENILTFAFCEQLTFRMLCKKENGKIIKSEAAEGISLKYDEVMVDEYQDVNDLQDAIFSTISNDCRKLFAVGDVKQSIYGFRGSNPDNFIKKEQAAESGKMEKIFLSENFRSRDGVCNAVNYLFDNLLAGQVGKVVYGNEERLKCAANFPATEQKTAELLIVDSSDNKSERIDFEGEAIADFIYKTINGGDLVKVDDNTCRKARFGDFAILLRSVVNKVDPIIEALSRRNIPVSYSSETFFDTFEIKFITSLLKVINNPKSDVDLLVVMMSPVFGFTADEMANIRVNQKKKSLYSSVITAAENGNGKCAAFLETLGVYRRIFVTNTLGNAVNQLYAQTSITELVSLMPAGETKLANLLLFSKLAADYCAKSTGGIYGFLRYMENLPEKAFKTGNTATEGVRIMTMHKAKGLQFPICILANLSGQTDKSDSTDPILKDEQLGVAFRYYDEEKNDRIKTVNYYLLSERAKEKTVEEELRLLYVAATRAQDKLCLVCSLNSPVSKLGGLAMRINSEKPHLNAHSLISGISMSDWVLMCAMMNKDFKPVLNRYGVNAPTVDTQFSFNTEVFVPDENAAALQEETVVSANVNSELQEQLLKNFDYKYPFETLSKVEAKVSVSRLANGEEAERFAFTAKPSFMIEGGLSPADAGSAMHHVMQYISFDGENTVSEEIKRLKEWRFISENEANSVNTAAIERFFESDIFAQIKKSDDVRREMRFLTEIPASFVGGQTGDLPQDAVVLVQGAVDLCFTEGDTVTVLDFKTDKVEKTETLKERYSEQLFIYSKACEKIFGRKVGRRVIYSFALSDYIEF